MTQTTRTAASIRAQARQHDALYHDALYNEGEEGYNPHRYDQIDAECAEDKAAEAAAQATWAAKLAAEDAEWTPEITQARRAAWNAWVRQQGGKIDMRKMAAQQDAQGWTAQALKKHLGRHGL